MKKYPRIREIRNRKPQGLCSICKSVLYNGLKPDKVIVVEFTYMRSDDEVYKAHSECIDENKQKLLDILLAV